MDVTKYYNDFIQNYNVIEYDAIWQQQSQTFKEFWNNRILNQTILEINDEEIDDIVKILDKNGKGNTKNSEAVARAMIPQGAWRRMFNEIHDTKEMTDVITKIFSSQELNMKAEYIDKLYKINQGHKNNLTGQSGNAINCLLAAYDPMENLSIISLNDRVKVMQYLVIEIPNWNELSIGQKIVQSNQEIIKYFKSNHINSSARTISRFFYLSTFRELWKPTETQPNNGAGVMVDNSPQEHVSEQINEINYIFGIEKHLEDFLIENWDKTELGKKHELIMESGEMISQQYHTDIGIIDILAREKETGNYVVIELKKNQSSDDTVGQLARYMGWIKEKKSNGTSIKGIIIAGKYDDKLHYALKMINNVEIFIYKVDFKLESHVKPN